MALRNVIGTVYIVDVLSSVAGHSRYWYVFISLPLAVHSVAQLLRGKNIVRETYSLVKAVLIQRLPKTSSASLDCVLCAFVIP
jgi:hypothetical protein